jgi:AraC family transcriptional regulator, regulatory protein of adaptative response / methylated-DNA-[protein]-cysteine methyltransferase
MPHARTFRPMSISEETAWSAVERRDRTFDGAFVFAVATTGIYCRPSCPARRPKRDNVRFFAQRADAEAAGFRACRRCRPAAERGPAAALVARVRRLLDAHADGITLAELARRTGVSPHHLQRVFRAETGVTPKQYLAARRAERLRAQLKDGRDVTTATYEAGYGSSSRVYAQSDARLGMTPGTYRDGGRGMAVRFTTVDTSLGTLLVAVTGRGVCAVSLGDDADALERALRDELPRAAITRADDPQLAHAVMAIVDQIEGRAPAADLPLDLRATAFQLRVWEALRRVPYGQTRTYGEVAAAIGRPSAVRAVAGACARNRVAIVVPCHRVIRNDGALGGYRWGIARKRKLLRRESGE